MPTSPIPDALNAALEHLRQTPPVDGSLWTGLLLTLGLGEAGLARVLRDEHGVEVIADDEWTRGVQAQGAIADSSSVIRVMADRPLLLCEDPWSNSAIAALARAGDATLRLALARPGQIGQVLPAKAHPVREAAPASLAKADSNDTESPVVRFVDQAIAQAYDDGASDIHFETDRRGVGLKFRLDGVMSAGPRLDDPAKAEEVISRIKVLAALNITERRRPQDGRIHWRTGSGDAMDLRVSIMPSIFGEDAVLRLLDKAQLRHSSNSMSLDALGFDVGTAAQLRELAMRPHGMLLITGPTGSGKTTTVYAGLSEVNDGLEKIITIEDPVEYELAGVLQIPVNEQKGLTFATGLRSILRHDPDKILVGEIRDAETAEIAVQSSLTGHLVFTTVHANSLFDVLGRFHHFGIERFALASALNGVVVQRLLRRICPHCASRRETLPAERDKLVKLDVEPLEWTPLAMGCNQCRQTGYRGRFVVAEVHVVDDGLRDLMVRAPAMSELKQYVYADGSRRLLALAADRMRRGMTTLEEVTRVVGLA